MLISVHKNSNLAQAGKKKQLYQITNTPERVLRPAMLCYVYKWS